MVDTGAWHILPEAQDGISREEEESEHGYLRRLLHSYLSSFVANVTFNRIYPIIRHILQ